MSDTAEETKLTRAQVAATTDHPTGIKSTRAELVERVALVKKMLCGGYAKCDVKRLIASKFGVDFRTIERYLARARREILDDIGIPKDEHQGNSLTFYKSVLSDPKARNFEKLKAQERIDKLLGLESPQRHEHTGSEGGPVQYDCTIHEQIQSAKQAVLEGSTQRLLERFGHRGNGQGSGNGSPLPSHGS